MTTPRANARPAQGCCGRAQSPADLRLIDMARGMVTAAPTSTRATLMRRPATDRATTGTAASPTTAPRHQKKPSTGITAYPRHTSSTALVAMEITRISHARVRADERRRLPDRRQAGAAMRRLPDSGGDFMATAHAQCAAGAPSPTGDKKFVQKQIVNNEFRKMSGNHDSPAHREINNSLFLLIFFCWHDVCEGLGQKMRLQESP